VQKNCEKDKMYVDVREKHKKYVDVDVREADETNAWFGSLAWPGAILLTGLWDIFPKYG
jgi:hypothetical protein